MTDMTKRRDQIAKIYKINCDDTMSLEDHCEDAVKKGWDARDAIANEQLAELKEDIRLDRVKPDDYMELIEQNKALKAQLDSNAKSWEVAKEIEIGARFKGDYDKVCDERDSLKAQVNELKKLVNAAEIKGYTAREVEHRTDRNLCNMLSEQLKAKDAQLEIALNALVRVASDNLHSAHYGDKICKETFDGLTAKEAIEQIQKMRGVCNLSQIVDRKESE